MRAKLFSRHGPNGVQLVVLHVGNNQFFERKKIREKIRELLGISLSRVQESTVHSKYSRSSKAEIFGSDVIMSLLEKKRISTKLDDTIPLTCHIEGQEKKDSYVVSCYARCKYVCYWYCEIYTRTSN